MQTVRWLGVAAIALTAFAAAALFAHAISGPVPHSEDEAAYLFQAQLFAQNRLTAPTPPLADAFWSPFVLDSNGHRFGKYPPGWPMLLSLGVRLNAPWLVNALLGAATLAMVALLGFCCYSPPKEATQTGLLAAALGLATPAWLFQSGLMLSHAASLAWATLALLGLCAVTRPGASPRRSVLTGAALGLAFITRPFAGLSLGLAIGLFMLMLVARRQLDWRALPWLVAGGLPLALLLPLYHWAIGGSPLFNPYLLVWHYDRIGFGPDVGPHGYTLHDAIFINTRLKLATLAAGLYGWPAFLNLLFLPIPFVARRANRWDWLLLGVIGAVVGLHLFYWAFGGADGGTPRYYYDALPAFLLLTARGILILSQALGRLRPRLAALPLLLVAGLVAWNLAFNLPPQLAAQRTKYGISPAPLQAVAQANLPQPALVLVRHVDSWADFAAPFSANSPTLNGPLLFAIAWDDNWARQLRRQFPDRSCWELSGVTLTPCPSD
ncbi:MAG: hypothetical protein Kow0031_25920 [Anaerolineae bacterium]